MHSSFIMDFYKSSHKGNVIPVREMKGAKNMKSYFDLNMKEARRRRKLCKFFKRLRKMHIISYDLYDDIRDKLLAQ